MEGGKLEPLEIVENAWRDCQEARDMRLVSLSFSLCDLQFFCKKVCNPTYFVDFFFLLFRLWGAKVLSQSNVIC